MSQFVFFIDGNGPMSFRTADREKRFADVEKIKETVEFSLGCKFCEVFIIHNKNFYKALEGGASNHVFTEVYHYFKGNRLGHYRYRGDDIAGDSYQVSTHKISRWASAIIHQKTMAKRYENRFFAYFAHRPYFAHDEKLHPLNFSEDDLDFFLSETLQGQPLSFMALSTCQGATPSFLKRMSKFSNLIVASPTDVHLSWYPVFEVDELDVSQDISRFARNYAKRAFDSHSWLYYEVSVGVYALEEVQQTREKNCSDPAFIPQTFYFKPKKYYPERVNHSGWSCVL